MLYINGMISWIRIRGWRKQRAQKRDEDCDHGRMQDKVMKVLIKLVLGIVGLMALSSWGFFGHERINRLAIFTLPSDMIGFYKKNVREIEELSVNPDKRRYAVPDEAPRHYIDLDDYGDSALQHLPKYWSQAVSKFGEDSISAHGVVPWHIHRMYAYSQDVLPAC
jgi:hypothetical protein